MSCSFLTLHQLPILYPLWLQCDQIFSRVLFNVQFSAGITFSETSSFFFFFFPSQPLCSVMVISLGFTQFLWLHIQSVSMGHKCPHSHRQLLLELCLLLLCFSFLCCTSSFNFRFYDMHMGLSLGRQGGNTSLALGCLSATLSSSLWLQNASWYQEVDLR